jgi:nucleotide-binding universal stress UspA family protein
MTMIKKILIPLDGSEVAEHALQPALDLAQAAGGEVVLLRCLVGIPLLMPDLAGMYSSMQIEETIEQFRAEAEGYLATIQQQRARPGVTIQAEVHDGDAAGVIVDLAAEEGVDLIVMSTHGYSGLQRWALGSVTERVLQRAPCPVLVIRSAEPITRVLITLDGSELAEHALEPALEIAGYLAAEVTLLRVNHPAAVTPAEFAQLEWVESGLRQRLLDSARRDAQTYLGDVVRRYGSEAQSIKLAVAEGPVADRILEFALTEQINLIAMSTHGYSGLRHWVYGSVTEKVLRGSHCSMLIVRPPTHK